MQPAQPAGITQHRLAAAISRDDHVVLMAGHHLGVRGKLRVTARDMAAVLRPLAAISTTSAAELVARLPPVDALPENPDDLGVRRRPGM